MPETLLRAYVRLRRNFEGFPFDATMLAADKRLCAERVGEALAGKEYSHYRLAELDEAMLWELTGSGLVDSGMFQHEEAAIYVSADRQSSVVCNVEDHVQIRVEASGGDITAAVAKAKELSRLIHSHYPFVKDQRIGWLTARPQEAGTGLQVCQLLHLPMLHMMQQIKAITASYYKEQRFSLKPLSAQDPKNPSALYWLCNLFTAYDGTGTLCQAAQEQADTLTQREQTLRSRILKRSIRSTYLDQVYRAYGILKYARRLNDNEFMGYWSKLRLGVTAGLIPLSLEKVDGLLQQTSLSQLKAADPEHSDDHAIHFLRADKVRAELEGDT